MKIFKKAKSKQSHLLLGVAAIIFGVSALACIGSYVRMQYATTIGLGETYFVDSGKVYYYDQWIYAADPSSFQLLGYGFAKDNKNIFYDGRTVEGAHYKSFTILSYGMAQDKNQVWIFDKPTGITTDKEIIPLGNLYFQKGNKIFYQGTKVEEADAATFAAMTVDHMASDKNAIYYRGKKAELER